MENNFAICYKIIVHSAQKRLIKIQLKGKKGFEMQ